MRFGQAGRLSISFPMMPPDKTKLGQKYGLAVTLVRDSFRSGVSPELIHWGKGYCSVSDGQHGVDLQAPVCPAFKEIGEKYGGFDLGLIPIGYVVFRPVMASA